MDRRFLRREYREQLALIPTEIHTKFNINGHPPGSPEYNAAIDAIRQSPEYSDIARRDKRRNA